MKALKGSPINVLGLLCLISSVGAAFWGYQNTSVDAGEPTLLVQTLGALILFGAAQLVTVLVFWVVHSVTRRYPDLRRQNAVTVFWLSLASGAVIIAAISLNIHDRTTATLGPTNTRGYVVVGLAAWVALLPHAAAKLLPKVEMPITPEQLRIERSHRDRPNIRWDYPVDAGRHWILFTLGMASTVGICVLTLKLTLGLSVDLTERYLYTGDFAYPHAAGDCTGMDRLEAAIGGAVAEPDVPLLEDQIDYFQGNVYSWRTGEDGAAFWPWFYLIATCLMKMWYMHVSVGRPFGWSAVLVAGVTRAIRIILIVCVSAGARAIHLSRDFDLEAARGTAGTTLIIMVILMRVITVIRRPGIADNSLPRGGEAQPAKGVP